MHDIPRLKSYSGSNLDRVAMPVGGIGTGTVSLTGWGAWRDWEIANRPAKGFTPEGTVRVPPFFLLRTQPLDGSPPAVRLLEGPLPLHEWQGAEGSPTPLAGLPRFTTCMFHAGYPFGEVELSDDAVPVSVRMQVFNPLIPGDVERSSLPAAFIRVLVKNTATVPVAVSVCATVPNFVGEDGFELELDAFRGQLRPSGASRNRNAVRNDQGFLGVFMDSEGVDRRHPASGSIALTTGSSERVSFRTSWRGDSLLNESLIDFWDDFECDGELEERASTDAKPMASLAVTATVGPGEERAIPFVLSWSFPNRRGWGGGKADPDTIVGNAYCERFPDAWEAANYAWAAWDDAERETGAFVRSVTESTLPPEAKEAALFNLSTLRTQTCFRTGDGRFYGWEGCFDRQGSCHGNCTHVWNYEHALGNLFPELARSMRELEFSECMMTRDGFMGIRIALPLERGAVFPLAAADGQFGAMLKLHREWRLSGDVDWLRRLWPMAKKSLQFAWLPGSWDADQDGVLEGCQHNTMDVEYFGPNPQMASWYLAALRAASEMASALDDREFADRCARLYQHGRDWVDAHLFNGEYYVQEVRPVSDWSKVRRGLAFRPETKDPSRPDFQLGDGCYIDQLVGRVLANFEGLGAVLDEAHQSSALQAILRHNRTVAAAEQPSLMRAFALGDEPGVAMISYPEAGRPAMPFAYFGERMTGFEYTLALQLILAGMKTEGLELVRDVRSRYDGHKRSPFDEAECGHHYVRAMSSWGLVLALSGFHYIAAEGVMRLNPAGSTSVRWPWSVGSSWGSVEIEPGAGRQDVTVVVLGGRLMLHRLELSGYGDTERAGDDLLADEILAIRVPRGQ